MKSQAYEKRNLEGFEGDTIMRDRIKQIVKDYDIDTIVEGGAFLGGTTRQFAFMAENVISIEIQLDYFIRASKFTQEYSNVKIIHGDTVGELPRIIKVLKDKKYLFFSDAHWYDNNPMLAELEIIKGSGTKPIIAIHDFKVPGHPELGFDTYNGQDYEWDWIKAGIEKIYGQDYTLEYNSEALGAKRGLLIIFPK